MKKTISLIKACMSSDMNIFRIKTKKNSKVSKLMLPIVLSFLIMFYMWVYANMILEKLEPLNLQYIALSLFLMMIAIIAIGYRELKKYKRTLIEENIKLDCFF